MFRDGLLEKYLNVEKSTQPPAFVNKMLGIKSEQEKESAQRESLEREEKEKYALKYAVIKEFHSYVLHRISVLQVGGQRLFFATRCNTANSINKVGGEEILRLEQGRVIGRFAPADYYLSSRGIEMENLNKICEKCFPDGLDYDYEN